MGNAQSRREAREAQRKKNNRKWIALGGAGVILLSGGALAYQLSGNEASPNDPQAIPSSCVSTQRVTVATNSTMAEVLKNIPVSADDCIALAISDNHAANDVAHQITADKAAPNLWIPDSSTRAQLALAGKAKVITKDKSLAKTPGVVVSKDDSTTYKNWNDVLAANTDVSMADPKIDSGAFLAVINAAAETSQGAVNQQVLTANTSLRAQTIGVDVPEDLSPAEQLDAVAQGKMKSAVVSEADYAKYMKDHGDSGLKAQVPGSATNELDFPMYQPAQGNESNKTVGQAADKISAYLSSEEGKKALADAGLRKEDNTALTDHSVGPVKPLDSKDPKVTADTWSAYKLQSAPMNALIAIDSSGSMGWKLNNDGKTRMDVTKEAVAAGSQLFPIRDSMGLWEFAYNLETVDGKPRDYREVVPIRSFGAELDGQTQREVLLQQGESITPHKDSYTGLNDTTLAAFRNIKKNYQNDSANVVVIMTDGEDTDPNGISTEKLIETIQREQDAENPIYFVMIGISEDANMTALESLATQIGGEAFQANSPEDIQKVFQEALTQQSKKEMAAGPSAG